MRNGMVSSVTDDGSVLVTEAPFPSTRLRSCSFQGRNQLNGLASYESSSASGISSNRPSSPGANGQCTNGHVLNGHASNGHTSNGHSKAAMGGNAFTSSTKQSDKGSDYSKAAARSSGSELCDRLCKINDVPRYLRFNPYILSGYRSPELSSTQCVASLCYFHNETVNILTHAISLMFFMVYMPRHIPWDSIAEHQKWLAYSHVLGSFSSWVGSSIYHLFMNHERGEGFYFNLLRWDVAGIWITQSIGASTTIYASIIKYPAWLQVTFVTIYVVLSLRALRDSILANSVWKRIMGFGYLFIMRIFAFLLRNNAIEQGLAAPLIHIIMQEVWPLLGSCISATRVPERWFPGRFDYILNSHNLMHVFVVLGAVHMHWATCGDLLWLAHQDKGSGDLHLH